MAATVAASERPIEIVGERRRAYDPEFRARVVEASQAPGACVRDLPHVHDRLAAQDRCRQGWLCFCNGPSVVKLRVHPVAGFVQVPCIERCAYGAVKAWTGFMIASNEIPVNRRVDFDTTVSAMALTAKEMNSKYKETSEGGLAVSVTLC